MNYIFFYVYEIIFWIKIKEKNRATISSISRKIIVYNIETFHRNVSEIRNVTFIFQNLQKKIQKRKLKDFIHVLEYQ